MKTASLRSASAGRGPFILPRNEACLRRSTTPSRKLFLRDLLEHAPLGFYADGQQREGRDQIGKSEGVQHVSARAIGQHQSDHCRGEERADAADAKEPSDCGRSQMRRVQFADINSGRAVDAGIDPADRRRGKIEPHP